jgi:hypothetical protein
VSLAKALKIPSPPCTALNGFVSEADKVVVRDK